MTIEENKTVVVRHLKEVLEQGHVELIPGYYTPDATKQVFGTAEEWRDLILWHHKVAPGFTITILDITAEEDKVMAHWQMEITFTSKYASEYDDLFPPLDQPVSWRGVNIIGVEDGKLVSEQIVNGWEGLLLNIVAPSLEKTKQNQAAVRKFVDALNRQDTALLAEVCTAEVAKEWTDTLPGAYATFKDHHIELVDMVADGEGVAVRMNTSGYHTGEFYGLPPSGKWWTNHGNAIIHFSNGKISVADLVFDDENLIKQLGGKIQPAAA